MALLYRAIWHDDTEDIHGWAQHHFETWARGKHRGDWELPEDGHVRIPGKTGVEIVVRNGSEARGSIRRLTLHEDGGSERWTTTLTTIRFKDEPASVWVDLERVADNLFEAFEVAAPRLVQQLIEGGTAPRRVGTRLETRPRAFSPKEIPEVVDMLCDLDRVLPMVVFTMHSSMSDHQWVDRVESASRKLAGVASVYMLPPPAVDPFIDAVGRDHAVWGGALRIYLPGFSLDEERPWRHPLVRHEQLRGGVHNPGIVVGKRLSHFLANHRAPNGYAELRPTLLATGDFEADDVEEMLQEKEQDILRLTDENERLEKEYLDVLSDFEALSQEVDDLRAAMGVINAAKGGQLVEASEVPKTAHSCSQALEFADVWLDAVVIPESASRDLELLDQAVEAGPWGGASWRGFRALQAYAKAAPEFNGGFWEWCENSQHALAWPATSKKLAMKESESVESRERLRERRIFAIDRQVDPSGELYMGAHLKIAEGGGDLAPRIYFYDDTKGATGKVHVGFFGPHKHVPNMQT